MSDHVLSPPPQSFKAPRELICKSLREAHSAWCELAGNRFAPSRKEIAPVRFKAVLGSVFLIDVVGNGVDFRFVLGGERIIEFMGRRLAGRLLSTLPTSPFFERMTRLLLRCVQTKEPVAFGPVRTVRGGREYLELEVIVMPLSDNGMSVTSLIGAVHFSPARDTGWPAEIFDNESST